MNQARTNIIREARLFIGTPFKHQGRTIEGMDCVGLIIAVGHNLGLVNVDFTAYERSPQPGEFLDAISKYLVRTSEQKPGNILVLSLPLYPSHLAFYTKENTIVHASSSRGRVIENRLSKDWMGRIKSMWTFPGVD